MCVKNDIIIQSYIALTFAICRLSPNPNSAITDKLYVFC